MMKHQGTGTVTHERDINVVTTKNTRQLPEVKSGAGPWGSEERNPEVTIVGTELVMELGGASMPDGCSGGRGGGGPSSE